MYIKDSYAIEISFGNKHEPTPLPVHYLCTTLCKISIGFILP